MTTTDAALRQKIADRIRNYEHLVKKDVSQAAFSFDAASWSFK